MAIVENGCSASTTFVWRKVKITAPPRPKGTARAKRAPLPAAVSRQQTSMAELRQPKTLQARARGGSELWWELTWGGTTRRFPGHVQLQDVMLCLFTHERGCAGHREEFYDAGGQPEA